MSLKQRVEKLAGVLDEKRHPSLLLVLHSPLDEMMDFDLKDEHYHVSKEEAERIFAGLDSHTMIIVMKMPPKEPINLEELSVIEIAD